MEYKLKSFNIIIINNTIQYSILSSHVLLISLNYQKFLYTSYILWDLN